MVEAVETCASYVNCESWIACIGNGHAHMLRNLAHERYVQRSICTACFSEKSVKRLDFLLRLL